MKGEFLSVVSVLLLLVLMSVPSPALFALDEAKEKENSISLLSAVQASMARSPDVLLQKEEVQSGKGRVKEELGTFDINIGTDITVAKESQILTTSESEDAPNPVETLKAGTIMTTPKFVYNQEHHRER